MPALHELPWNPLAPADVASLFTGWTRFWCIAGGWSLDLAAGRQSREHADTDVLLLRGDIEAIHDQLPGWELYAADPPGTFRRWGAARPIPSHVHDIWCRPEGQVNWQFQFMVMDHDAENWIFRRNRNIGGPLKLLATQVNGLPVIAPEIQLLFKGTSSNVRAKDRADFRMFLPHLSPGQRTWLREALERQDPGHPWLAALES